jgi:hypothetical protein
VQSKEINKERQSPPSSGGERKGEVALTQFH